MRSSLYLLGAAVMCSQLSAQGNKPVELQPLGIFMKTQMGLIAMPPTWQSAVLPGTVIYVDRREAHVGGCAHLSALCVIKNKYIIPTEDDMPKDLVNEAGTIDLGKLNSMSNTDVDLSVLVGKIAPSLHIGSQSHIDYAQSHFTSKGWGPKILDSGRIVKNSQKLQDDLTMGVVDGKDKNGKRAWKYFGVGYLVTSVVYATDLDIATESNFNMSASLQSAKDGGCTDEKLVSLLKGDDTEAGTPKEGDTPKPGDTTPPATTPKPRDTTPPASTPKPGDTKPAANTPKTGDSTKPTNTTPAEAKKEIDSGTSTDTGTKTEILGSAAVPQVSVKICAPKAGTYSLHLKPGVPIGFSAIPIIFDSQTNLPKVEQGGLEALHKALEKPDNQ
jgi:hypothetical protein